MTDLTDHQLNYLRRVYVGKTARVDPWAQREGLIEHVYDAETKTHAPILTEKGVLAINGGAIDG